MIIAYFLIGLFIAVLPVLGDIKHGTFSTYDMKSYFKVIGLFLFWPLALVAVWYDLTFKH